LTRAYFARPGGRPFGVPGGGGSTSYTSASSAGMMRAGSCLKIAVVRSRDRATSPLQMS
jgi:hypothetical protein